MNFAASETDGRRHRADGERSRQAILAAAAELATVEGLNGLSIGRLAVHVGLSKSGVFAHFRSKEELQLATVDAAHEVFLREVITPGLAAPEGLARVWAFCDTFLSHLERGVFPGGCFFIAAAAELNAQQGPVKDHLREVYAGLLDDLSRAVARAQQLGELDADVDVAQIVFELDSLMLGANLAYVFFSDHAAPDRARMAIRAHLARLASRARSGGLEPAADVDPAAGAAGVDPAAG